MFLFQSVVGALVGVQLASEVGAQSVVSEGCSFDTIQTSACSWTGACPVTGCENQCIANYATIQSHKALEDRAYSPDFYMTCPRLAYWIRALTVSQNGRRLHGLMADHYRAEGRALLDTVTSPGDSSGVPDSATLLCPDAETLADPTVQATLQGWADKVTNGLLAFSRGEQLVGDTAFWKFVEESPNMFAMLARFLGDPAALQEYLDSRCRTRDISGDEAQLYTAFVAEEALSSALTVRMCADDFGASQAFLQDLVLMNEACNPPFGTEPSCFRASAWFWMLSTPACATAAATLYNISDPAPLQAVAQHVQSIHSACQEVVSQDSCNNASSTLFTAIDEAHDSIPRRYDVTEQVSPLMVPAAVPPIELATPPAGSPGVTAEDGSSTTEDTEGAPGPVGSGRATEGVQNVPPSTEVTPASDAFDSSTVNRTRLAFTALAMYLSASVLSA